MVLLEDIASLATGRNIGLLVAAYITYSCVSQVIYYRFFHPLKDFPGPFWASVTRIWLAHHNYQQTELAACYKAHQKYGPVIRITPNMLLVSDSRKLPDIYHFKSDKSAYYITGSFGETETILNIRSHKAHAKLRKMVAGPYSFSNVSKMEGMMDERLEEWVQGLDERFAKTGDEFDFCDWAVFMAYDIVSDFGFGAPFGFVEKGYDIEGLIQGFHDGMTAFGLMGRLHPVIDFAKKTWLGRKLLIAKEGDSTGIGTLMSYRNKLLKERLANIEKGTSYRRDLLQALLDAKDDEGKPLGVENVRAEILLILLAGADTTGTAFQAVMHYIFTNPKCYEKMMVEIDEAFRNGHISKIPQYAEVREHCPYYVAFVKEAMRLCPSAPNLFPRVVSAPGFDLFGKFVPPGTEISCNPWFTGRDKALFGDDAEEFKPERWLDSRQAKEYEKYSFVFGYGARVCLGKDIAMMEMLKGPLLFFQRFNFKLTDTKKTGKFIVHGGIGFWVNIDITISERDC